MSGAARARVLLSSERVFDDGSDAQRGTCAHLSLFFQVAAPASLVRDASG